VQYAPLPHATSAETGGIERKKKNKNSDKNMLKNNVEYCWK
jgi:hypothetical protein